jgi:large subunit ribosomal protein L4
MELAVYNIEGSKTDKTVTLNDEVFSVTPNDHVIYLDVKQYMANKRQGTHSTKGRSEIKGSTAKLRRQKGTGAARIGNIKSPLLRGGGIVFGPKPRDYSFKINKKVKRLARKSALSYKVKNDNLMVIEDFTMEAPGTKKYLDILKKFDFDNKKTLLVLPDVDHVIQLSARNIPKARVMKASDLNTYNILHADKLVLFESAIVQIENILLK